jgi:CheY-like chemotaxis protein
MAYNDYSKIRVLIIDDFDNFRMTVSKMLQDFGAKEVVSAINGEDAMKLCRSKEFDLVLCDYNLGAGKNGHQVLEELRVNNLLKRQSLFLLVSADSSKNIVLAAYDYEPDAYLAKPITGKTLRQRLDRLLSQRDALAPVHECLDRGDTASAMHMAKTMITNNSRYASACQKVLGDLLLEDNQLEEAEALFKQVLEVRTLDWAQVGLAKVKQRQGDLQTSKDWLKKIIEKNPFCMPAYDALVDNCRKQDDSEAEQTVLQTAVDMSPMSIGRQQSLAKVADVNNDIEVAARALHKTVKLGKNSCRDSVENHIAFARSTAALFGENDKLATDLSREAKRVLEESNRRFSLSNDMNLQTQLLESQIYAGLGDDHKAKEILQAVEEQLDVQAENIDLDTRLDFINSLKSTGQTERSTDELSNLVEEYKGDEAALRKIDRLLDEPLSEDNRQRVAAINSEGIGAYKKREYQKAIDCFVRAKRLFPNHLGVHLNLVQALVGEMREYGIDDDLMENCLNTLEKVKTSINSNHKQFNRFLQLQDMARGLERESNAKPGMTR